MQLEGYPSTQGDPHLLQQGHLLLLAHPQLPATPAAAHPDTELRLL